MTSNKSKQAFGLVCLICGAGMLVSGSFTGNGALWGPGAALLAIGVVFLAATRTNR